jgi:hypothetical protein
MIINLIKSIKCKFVGHSLKLAGSCPFTGSTYDYCEKCNAMVPREVAND